MKQDPQKNSTTTTTTTTLLKEEGIEVIYDHYKPPVKSSNSEPTVQLSNEYLSRLPVDTLYHLGLDTSRYNLPEMFGDVKFVCMGGTVRRMKNFAKLIAEALSIDTDGELVDITGDSDRYSMFKVGPVLSVSHGIGFGSLSVLLHELFKLIHYAGCRNVEFFRIGTCGGLGVPPGTVVITEHAVDELLLPYYSMNIMGRIVRRPAEFDEKLIRELIAVGKDIPEICNDIKTGTTMSAGDFYETQSRIDGAYCSYTEDDQKRRMNELMDAGVINIEMEALLLGSMCRRVGIPCGVVCVTLVDRLLSDQVDSKQSKVFQERPQILLREYIKRKC